MPEHVTLNNGVPAIIRPIREDGAEKLAKAIRDLSPDTLYRRFFSTRTEFSPEELHYMVKCDGVDHVALVLAILGKDGSEIEAVGECRYIRDSEQPDLAEMAITVADAWQAKGVGSALIKSLAARAKECGITRWRAFMLADNSAMIKLLELVGEQVRRTTTEGTVEVEYRLK